jgi:hypothetical protein
MPDLQRKKMRAKSYPQPEREGGEGKKGFAQTMFPDPGTEENHKGGIVWLQNRIKRCIGKRI